MNNFGEIKMKEKLEEMFRKHGYSSKYQVDVMGRKVDVPVKYSDASALMVFFSISLKKAKNLLNSERLTPVSIFGNKCLLGITFFDYRDCPVGPYHEFTFSIPVLVDSKFHIPFLPIIFDSFFKNFGYYVILMGTDSDISRKHVEQIFPYPILKRIISVDFDKGVNSLIVNVKDGHDEVMSISAELPKDYRLERKGYNTYYSVGDKLYKVRLTAFSWQGGLSNIKNFEFTLGSNDISRKLKELEVSMQPLKGFYHKIATEVLDGPEEV